VRACALHGRRRALNESQRASGEEAPLRLWLHVVAKQKKTIDLTTSSSDESSSSDEFPQLRLVEQLKGKEKKVNKHSLMDSSRPRFVIGFLFFIVAEYACRFPHSFCPGKLI
jgi:hypothetical protein